MPQATDQGTQARVSLRDLLSVGSFGLRLMAAPDGVDALVRWAHPTELIDPRPYLSGQELVLTVGTSLQDDQRCRDFVDHLLDAGVTALGYGVGDVLDAIGLDQPMADLLNIIADEIGGRVGFHEGSIDWQPVNESDVRPGQDTLQHLSRVLAVRQHEEDNSLARRRLEVGRLVELVVQG